MAVQLNATQPQFQAYNAKKAQSPKFGIIDGGVVSGPLACATGGLACCAAPILIPIALLLVWKGAKLIKSIVGGTVSLATGAVKKGVELGKSAGEKLGGAAKQAAAVES